MSFGYNEFKFALTGAKLHRTEQLLNSFHRDTDPFPSGWVESIYYDTLDNRCFHECMDGSRDKTKFRIRRYDDTGWSQAQVKFKNVFGVKKWKCDLKEKLSGETLPAWSHLFGDDWIESETSDPIAKPIVARLQTSFGYLVPVLYVKYMRKRYRVMDYRVNLDTAILVRGRPEHGAHPAHEMVIPFAVMEMKTKQSRPYLPVFGALDVQLSSVSKYALGRRLLYRDSDVLNKYLPVPAFSESM